MPRPRLALFFIALCLFAALSSISASAHAQLESSNPATDSLISAAPADLTLTFSEPIDLTGVVVSVLDDDGNQIKVGAPRLDPTNNRRVLVDAAGISVGTYTVSWTNRSATDGHTLSGSYAFRVGGSSVAPAAATVEGQRPAFWAVLTRWIAFLLLAPAVGLLLIAATRRRQRLIQIGLALATVVTAIEPLLLAHFPPNGTGGSSLSQAISAEPNGWWIRLVALLIATISLSIPMLRDRLPLSVPAIALVALSGYALTSHAAGRENLAWAATAVSFLHNAAVATWIGALMVIVIAPASDRLSEIRGFSRRALPIALLAIGVGILNAGLIFPSLKSITSSDYGKVLIGKVLLVLAIFGLAAWHHLTVRAAKDSLPARLLQSMRVEVGLIVATVLFASTMAMLAPPVESHGEIALLDLAEPTGTQLVNDQVFVRMTVDPARTGENTLTAWATFGPPLSVVTDASGNPQVVNGTPLTDVQLVRVEFASLTHAIAPMSVDLTANGDGRFSAKGLNLTVKDWWRATVTVRRSSIANDLTAVMYLRLPDPNITGFDSAAKSVTSSNSDAQTLYQTTRDNLAGQAWTFYRQNLSGGNGGVDISTQTWSNGAILIQSATQTLIRMDGQRYFKQADGDWAATDDSEPEGPAGSVTELDGATEFQMGNQEMIGDVTTQVIHFYVPTHDGIAPAFYTWWVDPATGRLMQEAMVSRSHYMIQTYDWSAPPPEITPPAVDDGA